MYRGVLCRRERERVELSTNQTIRNRDRDGASSQPQLKPFRNNAYSCYLINSSSSSQTSRNVSTAGGTVHTSGNRTLWRNSSSTTLRTVRQGESTLFEEERKRHGGCLHSFDPPTIHPPHFSLISKYLQLTAPHCLLAEGES